MKPKMPFEEAQKLLAMLSCRHIDNIFGTRKTWSLGDGRLVAVYDDYDKCAPDGGHEAELTISASNKYRKTRFINDNARELRKVRGVAKRKVPARLSVIFKPLRKLSFSQAKRLLVHSEKMCSGSAYSWIKRRGREHIANGCFSRETVVIIFDSIDHLKTDFYGKQARELKKLGSISRK